MSNKTVALIPNYNGIEFLNECLSSLLTQTAPIFKIILIDDCSTDDSINYVKINFPGIEILPLDFNGGFTKAINEGIKYSLNEYRPDFIVLLNNDTKTEPDCLNYLIKAANKESKIAAVASNMLFYHQPGIINSQGGTINIFGHAKDINRNSNRLQTDESSKFILSPCFGAALLKTEYLCDIGLPDERYFSYYEDVDWGWRANILGYKVIHEPRAIVYHHGSGTWKNQSLKKNYLCQRNLLCTVIKNYELGNLLVALIGIFFYQFRISFDYLNGIRIINGKIRFIYRKVPLISRLKLAFSPLSLLIWNLKNIRQTLAFRQEIQKMRRVSDHDIFRYFETGKLARFFLKINKKQC